MKNKQEIESPAIITKTIPYGDTNIIVTALTHGYGKLTFMARGAKKSTKRFPGGLDILSQGTLKAQVRDFSKMGFLLSFQRETLFPSFAASISKISAATLFCEVCNALIKPLPHDPEKPYEALFKGLVAIENAEKELEILEASRSFLVELLSAEGILNREEAIASLQIRHLLETVETTCGNRLKSKKSFERFVVGRETIDPQRGSLRKH